MVTVGYERIRGLRERGQRRGGAYRAGESRTFPVSVETLFHAFASAATLRRWLPAKVSVRSQTPNKRMRLAWEDGTVVLAGFLAKGEARSSVAIEHQGLSGRDAVDAVKKTWSDAFDRLSGLLS
jgi:hypothetical protein